MSRLGVVFLAVRYRCRGVFEYLLFLMIRRPPRATRTDTLVPTRRSSDLLLIRQDPDRTARGQPLVQRTHPGAIGAHLLRRQRAAHLAQQADRKSTRLNSSH